MPHFHINCLYYESRVVTYNHRGFKIGHAIWADVIIVYDIQNTFFQVLDGVFSEVLKILQSQLNFTYTVVPSLAPTVGKYEESLGRWTGLIGELQRQEMDFVVMDMNVLLERTQANNYLL